jgi:two-component system chemotaxis response regulator CheY
LESQRRRPAYRAAQSQLALDEYKQLAYSMLTRSRVVRQEVNLVAVEGLIIDDSPMARRIIRYHLEQLGCKIIGEAENAALGVKLFREHKPKIVTLDLMMPAVAGVDAIGAFRIMRKENPSAAILVVSSVPLEKTRRSMTEEGALAYIIKPFNRFSFEQARTRLLRVFPELDMR